MYMQYETDLNTNICTYAYMNDHVAYTIVKGVKQEFSILPFG